MENTLENKAKFFAQYWGQNVLTRPKSDNKKWILGEEVSIHSALSKSGYDYQYFLELKPLSSITDDDAYQVARIVSPMLFEGNGENGGHFIDKSEPLWHSIKHKKKVMMVDIDFDGYVFEYRDDEEGYTRPSYSLAGADYLRSKGYAMPYMRLSVEKLQEYGWIKLNN